MTKTLVCALVYLDLILIGWGWLIFFSLNELMVFSPGTMNISFLYHRLYIFHLGLIFISFYLVCLLGKEAGTAT
jgi:hypothetical protein